MNETTQSKTIENSNGSECTGISAEACTHLKKNYLYQVLAKISTSLGDELINPKTVLVWIMNIVGAPAYLIGMLVPIRESGSMIPQVLLSGYIRTFSIRKWIWVIGGVLQGLAVLGMAMVVLFIEGFLAGWLIIGLLILFSLARALCSISNKDIIGKTIPKGKRGTLKGVAKSVSGTLAIGIGLYFLFADRNSTDNSFYVILLIAACSMWFLSSFLFTLLKEGKGEKLKNTQKISEAFSQFGLLITDNQFRNFVFSRAFFLCSALSAPYYVFLAQTHGSTDIMLLGMFIIANGVASSISAPVWGKLADASSKKVMIAGATLTVILGIATYGIVSYSATLYQTDWIYPIAFFVLGIAHSGVRLGRKTYIVDMADGDKRTQYVAVSNTLIGIILLATGSIGLLTSFLHPEEIILLLSAFGVAGIIIGLRLPEVENN